MQLRHLKSGQILIDLAASLIAIICDNGEAL